MEISSQCRGEPLVSIEDFSITVKSAAERSQLGKGLRNLVLAFFLTLFLLGVSLSPIVRVRSNTTPYRVNDWASSEALTVPGLPLLRVVGHENQTGYIEGKGVGRTFEVDVVLMGENGSELDPFWDVGGVEAYLNFNTTLLEAQNVTVDPDGWFASFWSGGILELAAEIDAAEGAVYVAFMGYGTAHVPVFGQGRVFSVAFRELIDSTETTQTHSRIYLENPVAYTGEYGFDSLGGLVNLTQPLGTMWHQLYKPYDDGPFELLAWEDSGDSVLGPGDQVTLENTNTSYYFDYHVADMTGTLNLTRESLTEFNIWATNSITEGGLDNFGMPGRTAAPTDPGARNGCGLPNWTGNFTVTFPFTGVDSITVHALPYTADEFTYTLTTGVDYEVHVADQLIELLTPVDEQIINEHWKDGVNNSLMGWPWIEYIATGIQSVFVDMNNGTARLGRNLGYEMEPPSEWWFEPDWPGEVEGWWALGYFSGPFNWPRYSDWWVNYTAASTLEVNYFVPPTTVFVDYNGSYADFLAITNASNTVWNEVYPRSWQSYTFPTYIDGGASGLSAGDRLKTATGTVYYVEGRGTDLTLDRKPWVSEHGPPGADPFFGFRPIVSLAGFPHPERSASPWHNSLFSIRLPHVVEDATFAVKQYAIATEISAAKTVAGRGANVSISANVTNYGEATGALNFTLYANTTVIGTNVIPFLPSGSTATLPFTWNTSGLGYGNYFINATIDLISGEPSSAIKIIGCWITLSIPGDLNGDFDVDIYDAVRLVGAYNSHVGEPRFFANADLDEDGDVDIYDVVILAGNYGERWTP